MERLIYTTVPALGHSERNGTGANPPRSLRPQLRGYTCQYHYYCVTETIYPVTVLGGLRNPLYCVSSCQLCLFRHQGFEFIEHSNTKKVIKKTLEFILNLEETEEVEAKLGK